MCCNTNNGTDDYSEVILYHPEVSTGCILGGIYLSFYLLTIPVLFFSQPGVLHLWHHPGDILYYWHNLH